MTITASLVKDLREKTGVGMMACKKALTETNGDFEKAVTLLREKGLAAATKKSDRSTKEGQVFAALNTDQTSGIIVELNCETDFVANNDVFQALGNTVAKALLDQNGSASLDTLDRLTIEGMAYKEYLAEMVLKTGENIVVKRVESFQNSPSVVQYRHLNGKIGVMVSFNQSVSEELGKDIAMHIAAAAPQYLSSSDVPAETLENEKSIIRTQTLNEGKPEAVVDKIVQGRLAKFFKEICLVEQPFVKDPDKSVGSLLTQGLEITKFVRFSLDS